MTMITIDARETHITRIHSFVLGRNERVLYFIQRLLPEAFEFSNRNLSSFAISGFTVSRFLVSLGSFERS